MFEIGADTRDQPATAYGYEHGIWWLLQLAQYFCTNGALARDNVGIIKGVDKDQAMLFCHAQGMLIGIIVGIPMRDYLATKCGYRLDLD